MFRYVLKMFVISRRKIKKGEVGCLNVSLGDSGKAKDVVDMRVKMPNTQRSRGSWI